VASGNPLAVDPDGVRAADALAADLTAKAELHLRRFELAEAEAAASRAAEEFPASARTQLVLGRILLATHRLDAGLARFREARRLDPGWEDALAWQIAALSKQRKFDEAVALGKMACTDNFPDGALVRVALARVYLDSSRPLDALPFLAKATELEPDDLRTVEWHAESLARLHRSSACERLIEESANRSPGSARPYYFHGLLMEDLGRCSAALSSFDRAFALDPEDPDILEWRITALRRLHRYDAATAIAAEAIERYPKSARLHTERAWLFCNQGRGQDALLHVETALGIDPLNEWALSSHIAFLRYLGQSSESTRAAATALERCGDSPGLHVDAARSERDPDRALQHINDALALDPRHPEALWYRIVRLGGARRFEDAEIAAQAGSGLHPYDPDFATAMADIYSGRQRDDACEQWLKEALRIDPLDADAQSEWGALLLRRGRLDAASTAFDEFLGTFPDDPGRHIEVADHYADEDRYEAAASCADEALKINSRDAVALRRRVYYLSSARRFDDAEHAARLAVSRRPDDPVMLTELAKFYLDNGRYLTALTVVDHIPPASRQRKMAQGVKADALNRLGRWQEATRLMHAQLDTGADQETLVTLSELYVSQKKYRRALGVLDRTMSELTEREDAIFQRGSVLLKLERWNDARTAFREYLDCWPGDVLKCVDVARKFQEAHRHEDAAAFTQRALAIDPDYDIALQNIVYYLLWSGRTTEAREAASHAATKCPDDPWSHLAIAYLHENQGNYELAYKCVEQALTLEPDMETALVRRFDLLLSLRRYPEARLQVDQIPRSMPTERISQFFTELAERAERDGQLDIALTCHQRAVEISMQDVDAALAYGRLLTRLKRYRQARWWLEGIRGTRIAATDTKSCLIALPDEKPAKAADALSGLYQAMGCQAKEQVKPHADRWQLARSRAWWRTGGPLSMVRRLIAARDDRVLNRWEGWSANTTIIETLPNLNGFDADIASGECQEYILGWVRRMLRAETLFRSSRRMAPAVAAVAFWCVLYWHIMPEHVAMSDAGRICLATVTIVGAGGALLLADWFLSFIGLRLAALWVIGIAVLFTIAALLVYTPGNFSIQRPATDVITLTRLMISLTIITAATLAIITVGAGYVTGMACDVHTGLFRRRHPRAAILDHLLDLIGEIGSRAKRNDLPARSRWVDLLEQVAKRMERDLPKRYGSLEPATAEWMGHRAAGAARWVRHLQQQVMLPTEGSWDRLGASLRSMAATVAAGDFAGLHWTPPSPVPRRRKRLTVVASALRTVTVMGLPALVVAVVGLLIPLGASYRSATLISLGWAVLYLLLSLDPALRDKIDTARGLLGTVRDTAKPDTQSAAPPLPPPGFGGDQRSVHPDRN
jgi:tetratricopeptide (TPR) repeat protein